MARVDDYANAFKLAAEDLKKRDPADVAALSGALYDRENKRISMDFIGRKHFVSFPDIEVRLADESGEVPLTEQVLILHYLNAADGAPPADHQVDYREMPSGEFYYPAFYKRAEAPLIAAFGSRPEMLPRLAPGLGGEEVEGRGDAAARFQALPRVPVTLVVWEGDEEFEAAGKILFDRSVSHYLSTEDAAWVSGMIVYRLMRLAG